MKPDLEALARRAVACSRWRWMPGMKLMDSGRILNVVGNLVEAYEHPWLGSSFAYRDLLSGPFADAPDLTDPATLGCLLALVREAWSEPILSVAWAGGRWYVVQRILRSVDALRWIDTATEAEALVATLDAAP